MKIPRPLPLRARLAAAPAVALMLWAFPAASQARDTTAAAGTFDRTFDSVQFTKLLIMVLCGALGAFVADLVADGGRLERWKKDGDGWTLGFLGKLIVGSVSAVIILSMNPPSNWWQLIGTALTAGVGAEAILLAIIASRKAGEAEKDREHAEVNARGIIALAQERLTTLKATALAEVGDGRAVPLLAERFSVEMATFAAAPATTKEGAGLADDEGEALAARVAGIDGLLAFSAREEGMDQGAVEAAVLHTLAVMSGVPQELLRPELTLAVALGMTGPKRRALAQPFQTIARRSNPGAAVAPSECEALKTVGESVEFVLKKATPA